MSTQARWLVWPLSAFAVPNGYVVSHSTLAHLPQFLWGVVTGYALLRSRPSISPASAAIAWELLFWISAVALLAISSMPAADRLQLPYTRYNFPWMTALVVLVILSIPRAPGARWLLETRPIKALGVISYGVYIYHYAAMQTVHRLLPGADYHSGAGKARFAAISLTLTIVVAALSYVVMERPLLRWTGRSASAKTATPQPAST
jgi:peptidoglycan/LPS O-acetylase OafA/YrhL